MKLAFLVVSLMLALLIAACGEPDAQTATSTPAKPADAPVPTGAQPTEPGTTTETKQATATPPAETNTPAPPSETEANTPETITQKPQPTYTIADLPPGKELLSLFGPNLTDEERNCMLPELRDGRMVTNALHSEAQVLTPTQESILRETIKCLKQDNLVRFLMAGSASPDRQVSQESVSCALDALSTTDLERTIVPSKLEGGAENALRVGISGMLGTTMIISYCLSDQEWERLEPELYDAQDRTALKCTIDALGGPRKYMETMMDFNAEAMDKMMDAEASCHPEEEGDPAPDTDPHTGPDNDPGTGEKPDDDH